MFGKAFYIVTLVLPIAIVVSVSWLTTPYYNLQKKILERMIPRSDLDYSRLMGNSLIVGLSIWSVIYLLFSLLENV